MSNNSKPRQTVEQLRYLGWVFYGIAVIVLLFFWGLFSETSFFCIGTWKSLFISIIPNILSPLVIFGILYFLFFRKNINFEKLIRNENSNWFETGYESYDDVSWESYFVNSKRLVVVAFFIEEWVINNSKYFDEFLDNENATLIIYLPDYKELNLLSKISALIPEHSQNELSKKIQKSITEIKKKTKNKTQQVSVSLYNKPFNYTYQLFDKKMLLSFNVLNRNSSYKSPFIVLNLEHSKHLLKFFSNETQTLEDNSRKININQFQGWETQE